MEKYTRVRYQKSPLVEVIFQLRFPTILNINTNQPSAFQDGIRERFPFFQEGNEQQNEMFISPNGQPLQMKSNTMKNYAFISANEMFKINLTSSFISVSTLKYTQWEDFKDIIEFIVPIFEEIYKPSFYIRAGLRYIDVITRENFGLDGCNWNELIESKILGVVTPEIESGVKSYSCEVEYGSEDDNALTKSHFELVNVNNGPEVSLLIDCDYFVQDHIEKDQMLQIAELLHDKSSRFISSAITKKLHDAMDPVEI